MGIVIPQNSLVMVLLCAHLGDRTFENFGDTEPFHAKYTPGIGGRKNRIGVQAACTWAARLLAQAYQTLNAMEPPNSAVETL